MDSSRGRCVGSGIFSSSLSSSYEEETIIGTKVGTTDKYGSQAKYGRNVKLGSHDKIFSSNLTYLLIKISLE